MLNNGTHTRSLDLDFVRGIAILLTLGLHFNYYTGLLYIDWMLFPASVIGGAGVDLFFVLSGFLIGGLILKEYKSTDSFDARRFLIRRIFKIWPIYYFYLFLCLFVGRHPFNSFFWPCFFNVQNYFNVSTKQLWSLAVEEHFYLAFAVLFFIFVRSKLSHKWIVMTLVSFPIICLFLRGVGHFYTNGFALNEIVQTHYRIDALAFGVLLAYISTFNPEKFKSLANKKLFFLILAIIGYAGIVFLNNSEHKFLYNTFAYTLAYLAAACFLLFCYQLDLLSKNIVTKAIAKLGVYSYAIYVYQFVLYRALEALLKKFSITSVPAIVDIFLIKYLGAIITGIVITKLIEKPCLRIRDYFFPPVMKKVEF